MFCRFCGKELEDNSKFCSYCGNHLDNDENENKIENNYENSNKSFDNHSTDIVQNEGRGKAIIITIVVIIIVFFTIFAIVKLTQNSDSTGGIIDKLTERDLRTSDYSVSTSQGLTSYSITITAKRKINSCNIELKIYNHNGEVIYSDTQTKNDLLNGFSYTYKFDFGFTNALSANEVSYIITGKCVD